MLILSDYFVSAISKDMYSVGVRRNRMDSSNGVFLLNSFMLNKLKISVESLDQVNEIVFRTKQLNEIVSYCLFLFSVISIKTHYRPAAVHHFIKTHSIFRTSVTIRDGFPFKVSDKKRKGNKCKQTKTRCT